MDAPEEEHDVRLQRASAELIADFDTSLKPFLWRTTKQGATHIRKRVRTRETERLVSLLEPFQELPQLLDPYLGRLLPVLTDALLAYLRHVSCDRMPKTKSLLMPLSKAICKLLYTICKIRGEKIVVRFFSAEIKHLELLLSAIEAADDAVCGDEGSVGWSWEERYVTLLWLSHLLLAPFDLTTISSAGTARASQTDISGLVWPSNPPGVTMRVVPLAIKYLESAGKERDAAKVLLVRISMRKDMQELGLLQALVDWALFSLHSPATVKSTYYYIGVLSYIAGILVSSSSTSDMDHYLKRIFRAVQTSIETSLPAFQTIHTSALARKIVIKILRTITILELRGSTTANLQQPADVTEIVENTIGHMLEALGDNDTPVRLAASKALSVVTLKLAPVMAAQVVEAVIDSLNHSVLWNSRSDGKKMVKIRDLSAVNPLEWHGLILTLSQLLYRRSPPPDTLSSILHALLIGLSFELRATSGSSVGTNVRDAACFGIWALARRYTTLELQSIDRSFVVIAEYHDDSSSILQVLATELVVAASLDPAGNIRRGASAALQELIGRHPDMVENGILNVQVVDYHKVALRSRAMKEVAPAAAALSRHNENVLLDGLLGWRGVGDGDAGSRRNAARCIGDMITTHGMVIKAAPWQKIAEILRRLEVLLNGLEAREVDQKHGLLLSFAEVLDKLATHMNTGSADMGADGQEVKYYALRLVVTVLEDVKEITRRKPDLAAEAICRVISKACLLIRVAQASTDQTSSLINLSTKLVNVRILRTEKDALSASTEAAFQLATTVEPWQRSSLISEWITLVASNSSGKPINEGPLLTLASIFSLADVSEQQQICNAINQIWLSTQDIESHVSLLQALCCGSLLGVHTLEFIAMIGHGLDDYTTDARGDVGSLIRLMAIKASNKCFTYDFRNQESVQNAVTGKLYPKVLRLAAEKLDKVRNEAQQALVIFHEGLNNLEGLENLSCSSYEYYTWLLRHGTTSSASPTIDNESADPELLRKQFLESLLSGYISAAGSGSESLIRSSRAALADYCTIEQYRHSTSIVNALVQILKSNLTVDRISVPAMEVLCFLFDANIVQHSNILYKSLFLQVQKAHYKSGNVRKLEAAIKIYGSLIDVFEEDSKERKSVLEKLVGMLLHPFPAVRSAVIDVLWVRCHVGGGVDWFRTKKDGVDIRELRNSLGIQSLKS